MVSLIPSSHYTLKPCRAKEMCWQRSVVSISHYSCITIPVLLSQLISSRCTTYTPSYYNFAWLWWADSCCSPSQRLVVKSTYDATRGDISSSDQHTIAVVHIVEFVYLTALVHKCIIHVNHTSTELCWKWTTTVRWTVLARFGQFIFGAVRLHSHYR